VALSAVPPSDAFVYTARSTMIGAALLAITVLNVPFNSGNRSRIHSVVRLPATCRVNVIPP
jgi:hypothetical protein